MTWNEILNQEKAKEYYHLLDEYIDEQYNSSNNIYPPRDNIFRALSLTPFDAVKVIILGQDPYHEEGQAQGLSFSVPNGFKEPPSLRNIHKELDGEAVLRSIWSSDLSRWSTQGVLLLNTVLTVQEGRANSHKGKGWEILTDVFIQHLANDNNPKVFMLWGSDAKSKATLVSNPRHLVLTSPHPSPLSAYRGFFGNNHFALCNHFLKSNFLTEIAW